MISLILKSIFSSGILLLFYHAVLSKEKIFRFNRYFLLFSVFFSVAIPFITIPWFAVSPASKGIILGELTAVATQKTTGVPKENILFPIIVWAYLAISIFFLGKMFFSFWKLKNIKGQNIVCKGIKLLIIEENYAVFSFWNSIYCNRKTWDSGEIDDRILQHERQHIQQKHSWDILALEVIKALFWINPVLYFYKKAIVSNHEFLADEAVLKDFTEINSYQLLILEEIQKTYPTTLTHSFNYYNTKKRFIMMTIKKGNFATIKQTFAISLLTVLVVGLSEKSYAQKSPIKEKGTVKEVKASASESGQLQAVSTFVPIGENTEMKDKEKPTVVATLVEGNNKSFPSKENAVTDVAFASPVEEKPAEATKNETPAEFPGGNNKIREEIMKIFDASKINIDKGMVKTEVFFTVTPEGKVKDFEAKGNTPDFNIEALKAIQTVAESAVWTPSKKNGIPQNFRYKMPLSMSFE
jgi:hypothetical protein